VVGVVGTIGVDDAPFRQINQQMLGRAAVGRLPDVNEGRVAGRIDR
jgi:hypothetical protein